MCACLPPGPVSPRTPCPHPRSRHLPPGAAVFPIHLASPGPWRAAAAEPCGGGDAGCRGSSFCPAPFPSPPAAPFRDVSSAPRPCVVGVRGGRTEDPWRGAEGPGWLDQQPRPFRCGWLGTPGEGVSHLLLSEELPGREGQDLLSLPLGPSWFSAGAGTGVPAGRETTEGFMEEVALELAS